MVTQIGLAGENAVLHVEQAFRNGQELVPILPHLEVDQHALSKTWDQQRKNKHATREPAVSIFF